MKKVKVLFLTLLVVFTLSMVISAAAKTELEYWVAVDPDRWVTYQESIKEFNQAHPDIEVTLHKEIGDNAQIQMKLLTLLAAGNPPDVIHVDTMYVQDMAKAGTIVSLSDLEGVNQIADNIFKGVMEPLIVDGDIYGFPVRANSIQLLWNKDLFEEAGLDPEQPPTTFDQVIEYAKKLTKRDKNGNVMVYGFETGLDKDPHWTAHAFSPVLWTYGGHYLEDGKAGLNSEAAVKAVEFWDKCINELKVSPTNRIELGFETGRTAMVIIGEWAIKALNRDFPDLNWGFNTLPTPSEDIDPIIPLGGRALVIPRGVQEKEAAWELISWVMSKEEQMSYTKNQVGLTPRSDLVDDPWFNDHRKYQQAVKDMEFVKAKSAPAILEMNTILSDAIQEAVILGKPIQESLDKAAEKYNAVLEDN